MNMLRNEYASSSSLLPQAPSVTASVPSRYMRKPTLVRSHGIFVFITAAGSSTAYGGAPSRREPLVTAALGNRRCIFVTFACGGTQGAALRVGWDKSALSCHQKRHICTKKRTTWVRFARPRRSYDSYKALFKRRVTLPNGGVIIGLLMIHKTGTRRVSASFGYGPYPSVKITRQAGRSFRRSS